jgi:hypothetical protein
MDGGIVHIFRQLAVMLSITVRVIDEHASQSTLAMTDLISISYLV